MDGYASTAERVAGLAREQSGFLRMESVSSGSKAATGTVGEIGEKHRCSRDNRLVLARPREY